MRWTLLIGRLLFGGFFLMGGLKHFTQTAGMAQYAASQGVPLPQLAVLGGGTLLVLGGLSVLLGFAPRIGLLLIILFLVPVSFTMHAFWSIPDPQQRMMEMQNFMKNLALTGAALGLMAIPLPWRYALDEKAGRKWPEWTRRTGFHRPAHQT